MIIIIDYKAAEYRALPCLGISLCASIMPPIYQLQPSRMPCPLPLSLAPVPDHQKPFSTPTTPTFKKPHRQLLHALILHRSQGVLYALPHSPRQALPIPRVDINPRRREQRGGEIRHDPLLALCLCLCPPLSLA